jgi:hypothetical protein
MFTYVSYIFYRMRVDFSKKFRTKIVPQNYKIVETPTKNSAPAAFRGIWALVKPWMAKKSSEKIIFTKDTKVMRDLVDEAVLVEAHGGTAKECRIFSSVHSKLTNLHM